MNAFNYPIDLNIAPQKMRGTQKQISQIKASINQKAQEWLLIFQHPIDCVPQLHEVHMLIPLFHSAFKFAHS